MPLSQAREEINVRDNRHDLQMLEDVEPNARYELAKEILNLLIKDDHAAVGPRIPNPPSGLLANLNPSEPGPNHDSFRYSMVMTTLKKLGLLKNDEFNRLAEETFPLLFQYDLPIDEVWNFVESETLNFSPEMRIRLYAQAIKFAKSKADYKSQRIPFFPGPVIGQAVAEFKASRPDWFNPLDIACAKAVAAMYRRRTPRSDSPPPAS